MSYLEALRYLETLVNYEKLSGYPYQEVLNLKRVQDFLDLIHNPERSIKFIHVAGTKGKGSTCAFITYILREAGFKTGLYTSPHLGDFRERIRILLPKIASSRKTLLAMTDDFEGMIPKSRLSALVNKLKPAIDKLNRSSPCGALSFFEVCTILALVYFKEEKVGFAVLETGLGGRLDATNIVRPEVSVITPISYEHMDKLGRTLKKIASEKAGIIKKNSIVISAPQTKEARSAIVNKCGKENSKLFIAGKDIKFSGQEDNFRVATPYGEYKNLKIRLRGEHQIANASVALTAIQALSERGIKTGIDSVRRGLYNTVWPGRCEVMAKAPLIVLDGAQNSASANAIKKTIEEKFRYGKLILILGVSNDKDIKGIADELYDLAATVILTKADTARATNPEILARYFKGKDKYITDSVAKAMTLAKKFAQKKDLILVTGSLFVVGEARKLFPL
jgi:dihydrofolate synthase/folylpolyglutamate synthase